MSHASVVAIIPARGGSKGVAGKNLASVGGVPLVARAVRAAQAAGIERVIVSTDGAQIAEVARRFGAEVVDRPAELASDTASSESALLHALQVLDAAGETPRTLVFLQATSPFIDPVALRRAIARVTSGVADSVFSAVETYEFLWRRTQHGALGINHEHVTRPRRQDREPHYRETGAFYVLDVLGFRLSGGRFFGRIDAEVVAEAGSIEIDTAEELETARLLAGRFDADEPLAVRGLVMDFDGVHTDDSAHVFADGTEAVTVSRSDGLGIARLRAAGLPMLILSTEHNPVVAARAAKLRIPVAQAVDDKAAVLSAWAAEQGIDLADIAFVGNDVNDVPALAIVGWPVVVPGAAPEVARLARIRLTEPGGRGAIRELADRILAHAPKGISA